MYKSSFLISLSKFSLPLRVRPEWSGACSVQRAVSIRVRPEGTA